LSNKSIIVTGTTVIFQGQDGLYGINGYTCKKLTDKLDPFFRTIDQRLTRSVMNNDLDQYIFWTDQGVVVFDYQFGLWFLWDNLDASKGITVDNDRSIRMFSSSQAIQFIEDKNDSGDAIDAWIKSAWFDLKDPGLLKKATDIRIYAMNNAGQSVELTYYLDWTETKIKGPFTVDFSNPLVKTVHRNLDIIQSQSFSFMFRNNEVDENLNISGYEIETGIIQAKDKNVK